MVKIFYRRVAVRLTVFCDFLPVLLKLTQIAANHDIMETGDDVMNFKPDPVVLALEGIRYGRRT